jgi:hypothetical protein
MNTRNILYVLPLLVFVGCSDAVSVTGTVKLADGTPFTMGYVSFESATTNVIGPLDRNGNFSLFQIKPGDRVPPGTYRGAIMFGGTDEDPLPFPSKYTSFATSGLTVTVERGKPVTLDIVLE